MTSKFIFLGLLAVAALPGCSVYRSGQTPDDVYYSPAREVEAGGDSYLSMDDNNRNRNYRYDDYAYTPSDDYWLRMRVRNPYRWSTFYDYDSYYAYSPYMNAYGGYYGYNPYMYGGYGLGLGFGGSYWNNYYYWNSYYNPYCNYIIIGGGGKGAPSIPSYNTVRTMNIRSYNNATGYNNNNRQTLRSTTRPGSVNQYNNGNVNGRRTASSGRETYYTPSNDRPVRSYTPTPSYSPSSSGRSYSGGSTGSSGGGSSSSSAGSRPTRN